MKNFIFILGLFTVTLQISTGAQEKTCPETCDRLRCENFECSTQLFAKDNCNCCDICVRREGEVCGGLFGRYGKCAKTLTCAEVNTAAFLSDEAPDEEEDEEEKIGVCEGARDCKLSAWSSWTKCNAQCGFGTMKRKRIVLQVPKNGGKPCPIKHEKKGCFQQNCEGNMVLAQILPAEYRRQPFGSYKFQNILPDKLFTEIQETRKSFHSHCVNFKLMSKHPYCQGTWAEKLKLSKPMCVECQPAIMDNHGFCKGEGIVGNFTSWVATGVKTCSGLWMRVGEKIPNCKCTDKKFQNFIFI